MIQPGGFRCPGNRGKHHPCVGAYRGPSLGTGENGGARSHQGRIVSWHIRHYDCLDVPRPAGTGQPPGLDQRHGRALPVDRGDGRAGGEQPTRGSNLVGKRQARTGRHHQGRTTSRYQRDKTVLRAERLNKGKGLSAGGEAVFVGLRVAGGQPGPGMLRHAGWGWGASRAMRGNDETSIEVDLLHGRRCHRRRGLAERKQHLLAGRAIRRKMRREGACRMHGIDASLPQSEQQCGDVPALNQAEPVPAVAGSSE